MRADPADPACGVIVAADTIRPMSHVVAVLALPRLSPFELSVVVEVFGMPRPELGPAWDYEVRVCTEDAAPLAALGQIAISTPYRLDALERADTVVLPTSVDVERDPSPAVLAAIRRAAARRARLVSICSGAFVLAATGLLDGRRATTHWRYADLLARRFPRVEVDADVLYVDEGQVLTGAGTAAAIDLCLHLVRRDHGASAANSVARRMVVAPHRPGGQAQYAERPVPPARADDPVEQAIAFALERLAEPISVPDMARAAHLAPRSLTRRFTAAVGMPPAHWLLEQRILAALPLLEDTDLPIEAVGRHVGFPTPAAFRRHFGRFRGISPSAHRRTFAATGAAQAA